MIIDPNLINLLLVIIALLGFLTVPLAAAVFVAVVILLTLNPAPIPPDFFVDYSLALRLNSPALLSIPLFALSGELAVAGGIADRLLSVAALLGGHGSRAAGPRTILECAFFATISGVGSTAIKAESQRLLPQLTRAGYSRETAAGALACAAVLSIIIPASVPLTVYAATITMVPNIVATAAFFPGVLMALTLLAAMTWYSSVRFSGKKFHLDLLLPATVLSGVFTGFFTAPEAGAYSCAYCLLVGKFLHKSLRVRDVWKTIPKAATGAAAVLLLAGMGGLFAMLMSGCGFSERVAEIVFRYMGGRVGSILLMNAFLLGAGCFLDMPAIISLLVPLMVPLVAKCGMPLAHFGVMVVMNIAIGLVTPPQAWNIAAASQMAGVPPWRTARAMLPFFFPMVGCLLVVSFWPDLSLWLPRFFGWPV